MSAEVLLREMSAAGVDRAVLVPPLFEGHRNDYALAVAAGHPDLFRVMARTDLAAANLLPLLDQFAADPLIAGVRIAFLPVDAGSISGPAAAALWPAARERGLPVMVHCPGQLAELGDIARRHPGLKLAVDHLGLSGRYADGDVVREVGPLLGLAVEPGICVKLSALPCYSTEPYPHPALHGPARAVISAFGPERVFWGSDLSRLPGRYGDAVTMVRDHLGLDSAAADAVLGGSLLDWLGWK
jgi:predicted TIM-barrel fold metal-dependent hydrolase